MVNEIKFTDYVNTKNIKAQIDLGDTLKCKPLPHPPTHTHTHTHAHTHTRTVYINHRPAFGISPAQFEEAFKTLGQRSGGSQQWTVDRPRLLELLQEKGTSLCVFTI